MVIDRIIVHHCLEVIVSFVDIDRIIDHHCLEVIVCFVDIDRIIDILSISTKQTITSRQ
jgi:hypothetical protein